MGQTLSEPVTTKDTKELENHLVKVGSSCMQGWRINMEDAHTHILGLADEEDSAFFAVYDGHGGAKVAQYAGEHLHETIIDQTAYKRGDLTTAMRDAFLMIDNNMKNDENLKDELAGTTAIVVIMKEGKLHTANVGDSRGVVSISGHARALSQDHKPCLEEETNRIIAAGGWVEFNRVNGNLALSRALGDFIFKRNDSKAPEEQIVTALPDITVTDITPETEFLVLACDGIWDVLTNQEVVDFIRPRIAQKMDPAQICEELMTRCLAPDCQMGGLGCDNMTVVLVCLLQNKTYEHLAHKCSQIKAEKPPWNEVKKQEKEPKPAL